VSADLPDKERVRWALQQRLPDLLHELGFNVRAGGQVVNTVNPRSPGAKGAFAIWLGGARPGSFYDLQTGDGGDVYELIRYVLELASWLDALRWAANWTGLTQLPVAHAGRSRIERENARARIERERTNEAAKRRRVSEGLFWWWKGLPPISGTPVETYLREARGIPLERIGSPKFRLSALRYCDRLQHRDESGRETYWPAMVAAMTREDIGVCGVHRTWLAPDGRGKADVDKPKKMQGTAGSIRLSRGASGLSAPAAAARGIKDVLAIGEGIETCLTVAAARPTWRVWAAGSLDGMGRIPWPECAGSVVLLKDRDLGTTAQRAFARVLDHWRHEAHGRRVSVVESEVGNDFNDWAKGAA